MIEKTKEKPLRISRDDALMLTAGIFSLRSTCNTGNGAVLAREGRIISVGYNGAPAGQRHCLDSGCILDLDKHCQRAIHAEVNVIAMAAKYGISTEGAELFCTMAPCPNCSKLLVNSGIIKVTYSKSYPDMSGIELLKACGIKVEQYEGSELSAKFQKDD